MAVLRDLETGDNTVNNVATLAFFCCVFCVTLMLKFGRFKTSFNVYSGSNKKSSKYNEISDGMSIIGAYRTNRDEIFIYNNNSDTQRKITPVPVPPVPPPIPPETQPVPLRQTKSTSDLIRDKNLPPNLRQAQSGISLDPRGAENENSNTRNQAVDPKKNERKLDAQKKVEKQRQEEQKKLAKQRAAEQKKLEKQRIDEQKKREKLASQEQAKQDKLRKEREKKEAQQVKKDKKTKKAAPQKVLANPLAQSSSQTASNPPIPPTTPQYSTNTLDSSISKTSGPPPYSEIPRQERMENESNSNVTFSKPIESDSWEMVSKHRQNVNMNRPVNKAKPVKGQTTMDLNYTLGENSAENSEA